MRERSPKHQTRKTKEPEEKTFKRKQNGDDITMDAATVKKARSLVKKAKTMKDKKEKKKKTKVSN
jgi:hypothetical protein